MTELLRKISVLHTLALMTPGPDFILAVRNSLLSGKKSGVATAFGFGLGIAVHVSYCLAGVTLLFETFPEVLTSVRIMGGSYLVWLGISALKAHRPLDVKIEGAQHLNLRTSFLMGLVTNLLNPKAILYILGMFTSVIPPHTELMVLVSAGLIMVLLTVLWFTLVSFLFGTQKIRTLYLRLERPLNYVFGGIFVVMGLIVCFSRHG